MSDTSPLLLYVEDDFQQRILLSEILEQSGFRVLCAAGAQQGLELAARENCDAFILDYDLPDMTGAQLAQEIRALEPSAKIVLLSGRPELSPGELVYIDIHVVKGSLTEKLLETIYSLLRAQNTLASSEDCHYA